MEKQFAYVELLFYENTKKYFKKVVREIVPNHELYYSDVISRICGDVTDKLHFTVFYGLDKSALKNRDLKELVKKIRIKELKMKKLVLFEGYQMLYKVLCVEVDEEDKNLFLLSRRILDFEHDTELEKREFKPHITLAYVRPEYVLPSDYTLEKKEVRVKRSQLSV